MNAAADDTHAGSVTRLREFARPRPPVQRCELCSAVVSSEHPHLVEVATRRLACACEPCAILFSGHENGAYRRVPRSARFLPDFQMTDAQWSALGIPIGLAFFFSSTAAGRVVAMYPSPAGATESLLALEAWHELAQDNPMLATIEPDVEALLVHRIRSARECYLAPIDRCYQLVGLIRQHWRGFSGGDDVWREIDLFFARLKERAT